MTEEAVSAAAEAVAAEVLAVDQEKCIKQLVQIANRKQKYLLCHLVTDPFIAGNVTQSTNQRDINNKFFFKKRAFLLVPSSFFYSCFNVKYYFYINKIPDMQKGYKLW